MLVSPAKNKAGDWLLQGMVNPVLNCNSNFRFFRQFVVPAKNKAGDWLMQRMLKPVLNCSSNSRFLDSVGQNSPGVEEGWRLGDAVK